MTERYTLPELWVMDGGDIIEVAYEAWLNSDDCAHWDVSDIRDRCSEDNTSDLAMDHFRWWFEDWLCCEVPDPDESWADGIAPQHQRRIEALADEFAYAVFDGIEQQYDFYQTLQRLPR